MSIIGTIAGALGFGTYSQPDWRQSVQDCLGGEERACEYVPLQVPGIVTPGETFAGGAQPLSAGTFEKAASYLNAPVAAVKAVAEVESLGSSYLLSKRPKILFEAHVFSRLTGGKFDASHPNVSSRRWNKALYGAGGEHQYARLKEALALDQDAALKAASWGAFQILALNCKACGFPTPESMVATLMQGEDANLYSFVRFVMANPSMLKALRAQNWKAFAKAYNGPSYSSNGYDRKLSAAFARNGG